MSRDTTGKPYLLINEPALQVLPSLAVAIGLNQAVALQQLHFLMQNPKNGKIINGYRYIYNTYNEWKQHFPFWSETTIKRTFQSLEKLGLVQSIKAERHLYNQRKSYTIDYAAEKAMEECFMKSSKPGRSSSRLLPRSDQFEPIEQRQVGPFKDQRLQQKEEPPTPGETGGYDFSFSGRDQEQANTDNPREHNQIPGAGPKARLDWAATASNHQAGPAFLVLTGLPEFPRVGRQSFARAFVGCCESGTITSGRLKLITTMRARVDVPQDPEKLIKDFDNLVADAREAAQERITEIDREITRTPSDPYSLMQGLAAADSQITLFTPEELFGSKLSLPFARWLLLVCCIKRGLAVEAWKQELRAPILDELARDSGAVSFLREIECGLDRLGVGVTEIDAARSRLLDDWRNERSTLESLIEQLPTK